MKFGGFKKGKTKNNIEPGEELPVEVVDELIESAVQDGVPTRRVAPIQELPLDAGENVEGADTLVAEDTGLAAEEEGEPVKLVEVQASQETAAPEPPPPAPARAPILTTLKNEPAKPANEPLDLSNSISNIFNNLDDEENPLANLIKVLPEVAASELIDDLKEINEIIKDWQKK